MAKDYSRKIQLSAEHMQKVFGAQDAYVKKLEEDYDVTIVDRNGSVTVTGEETRVEKAVSVLELLTTLSERGNEIEEQNVDYAMSCSKEDQESVLKELDTDCICHTIAGRPIKPKTLGQKAYVDAITRSYS